MTTWIVFSGRSRCHDLGAGWGRYRGGGTLTAQLGKPTFEVVGFRLVRAVRRVYRHRVAGRVAGVVAVFRPRRAATPAQVNPSGSATTDTDSGAEPGEAAPVLAARSEIVERS